jgi:hypothetical protein
MTRISTLTEMLSTHSRVALIGGPSTGLTELAYEVCTDRPIVLASEFDARPWAEIPGAIELALGPLTSWLLVGGVHVARLLRKGLKLDAVVYVDSDDQLSKQTNSIFMDWRRGNRTVRVVSPDR